MQRPRSSPGRRDADGDRGGGRDEGPLRGVSVLVPRAVGQAEGLSERIERLGGEPVPAPTIEIQPGDRAALARAVQELAAEGPDRPAAVCFTSPNGVAAVAAAVDEAGHDARVFTGVTVAAVGPGTAAALRAHLTLRADLIPARSTTEALAEAFPSGHGRVLLPRADLASPTLSRALARKGYVPVDIVAYVTGVPRDLPSDVARRLGDGDIDLLAFTSSSTVRNFATLAADLSWTGRVVSIGPVTTATCRDLGIDVTVEAGRHDLDGLVEALVEAAAGR